MQNHDAHAIVLDLPEGRIEARLELPVGGERRSFSSEFGVRDGDLMAAIGPCGVR